MYPVGCTLYMCTLYTVHCTLYTVYCTLYTVHCTLYTVHCTAGNDNVNVQGEAKKTVHYVQQA